MTGRRVDNSLESEKLIEALLRPHPSLDLVLDCLQASSWRLRRTAAEAASRIDDPNEATVALIDLAVQQGPDTRASVAEAILAIGQAAVPALNEAFLSGSHPMPIRRLIVEVLGTIGSQDALDALTAAIEDEDANVRMSAAEALGRIGGPRAVETLLDRLGQDEFMVTSAIAEALWKEKAHVRFEIAFPLLQDKRLVRPAMKLLGLTDDPRAVEPMVEALASNLRPKRQAAILASARLLSRADVRLIETFLQKARRRRSDLADSLSAAMQKESSNIRGAALEIAALLAWPELLLDLLSLVTEPETGELALAATANILRRHGLPSDIVPQRLEPDMRSSLYLAAAQSAGVSDKDARLSKLVDQAQVDLRSSDPEMARTAATLLAVSGDPSDLAPMVDLACRSRDDILGLDETCASLGTLGRKHPKTVVELLDVLGEDDLVHILPRVAAHMHDAVLQGLAKRLVQQRDKHKKAAGLLTLAHLPCKDTSENLIHDHLANPDPDIRALAARALPPNCSNDLFESVCRLLEDEDARVRRAACFGLGRSNRLDAAHAIIHLIERGDGADVLAEGINTLTRLGARLEKRLLVPLIRHHDSRIAKAALEASRAGEPDPTIADSAIDLLDHERWDLRAEALRTIAYHGPGKRLDEVLRRILHTERDETVLDVAKGLLAGR